MTTTVAIGGATWPHLPVKTTGAVPKPTVREIGPALRRVAVQAPVEQGDVVMVDILGTGVDVVATRTMR